MTPRILMLHGYSQNGSIFSKRLGALRKLCGKNVDFVFVDAPHVLQPADLGASVSDLAAPEATTEASDPSLTPRGWWTANHEKTKYVGVEESLEFLKGVLSKDRFDGVFGFSQGASLAAFLAALLEDPNKYPPFLIDGKTPPHPPMKFCVSVSGFRMNDPVWEAMMTPSYSTLTLHVIGTNDVIIPVERSRTLLEVSTNKRVEYHDGGHFIPSKTSWRNFWKAYLMDPTGDVPSPGGTSPL